MITELKLVNFRNFSDKVINNFQMENFIIWENGKWKTNILEALSILWNNSITKLNLEDMVKKWEDYFFIEAKDENGNKYSFYYSKDEKKRSYMVNNKKTIKKKFVEKSHSCVIFSPIMMNMMYLSPSLRRDFIDEALKSSYSEYDSLLKEYKKIIRSRNSTLKAINENKASLEDLKFWDEKFVKNAIEIYSYRYKFVNFLEESIINTKEYFSWKIENISFEYISKVDKNNVESSLRDYLEKNLDRDIIIWRTAIWPHVDDFEVRLDNINLVSFASRWETKSVIIYLKLLEWIFIEKKNSKKPILIIDDLLSELDQSHKDMLLNKITYYQTFISNINEEKNTFYIKL